MSMQSNLRLIINLRKSHDRIPGGLADDKPDTDFDPEDLAAGIRVEMEHTSIRSMAKEIAKDHLSEDPDYYRKLRRIEKAMPGVQPKRLVLKQTSGAPSKPVAPSNPSAPIQASANTFYGGTRPHGGGWMPIPGSKHGGFHRRQGQGYQYWYPDKATHDMHHPEPTATPAQPEIHLDDESEASTEKHDYETMLKRFNAITGFNRDMPLRVQSYFEKRTRFKGNSLIRKDMKDEVNSEITAMIRGVEYHIKTIRDNVKKYKNEKEFKKLENKYYSLKNDIEEHDYTYVERSMNGEHIDFNKFVNEFNQVLKSMIKILDKMKRFGLKNNDKLYNSDMESDIDIKSFDFTSMSDEKIYDLFTPNLLAYKFDNFSYREIEKRKNLIDKLTSHFISHKSGDVQKDNYNKLMCNILNDKYRKINNALVTIDIETRFGERNIENGYSFTNSSMADHIASKFGNGLHVFAASNLLKLEQSKEKVMEVEKNSKLTSVDGYYDRINSEIVVKNENDKSITVHEYGHFIDEITQRNLSNIFSNIKDEYISEYANLNEREDVAESFCRLKNPYGDMFTAPIRNAIVELFTNEKTAKSAVLLFRCNMGIEYTLEQIFENPKDIMGNKTYLVDEEEYEKIVNKRR